MKVQIEHERCTGHGRCYALAPQVFESDDDGYGQVRFVEVPPGQEQLARTGASNCPERAVVITD